MMRFSEAWLREWVNPEISTDVLADQLSMAGLEVDSIEPAAPEFTGVVVGEVISCEQHPDADKLRVCQVNIGAEENAQIVCGAKNVAAGMKAPVATLGACLSADVKIKKTKLRGMPSLGMICSASELGLAESSDGIMPLPADAPVGQDFREYLNLDDSCIEVDLTPDRGDCLSLAGIAREVGVINRLPVTTSEITEVAASVDDTCPVDIQTSEACPRYLCRVIKSINSQATTPDWMLERLRRSGVRGISPVVDVTNYVMLELGQPMHGFDLAKVQGGIVVRMANANEKLQLLDGSDIELNTDTLVIADQDKPLALAGIMGGKASGVGDSTTDVLLEAAFFAPLAIAGKARGYSLHTDSSHRFERGVDFDLPHKAMQRATALLLDIVGGKAGPIVEAVDQVQLPQRGAVNLRRARIPKVLGIEISDASVEDILQRLDMQVVAADDGWLVTPPSVRFDISIEVDLIEEIGRIYGYANIPASLSSAPVSINLRPEAQFSLDLAKQTLVDQAYQEVVTYSFISPEMAEWLTPHAQMIELANPISADMSVMRASIWPGLLTTMQHNLARQQEIVRIFESGLVFQSIDGDLQQTECLAGAVCGPVAAAQWSMPSHKVDFFDLKGDLQNVLSQVADLADFTFMAGENPALHPGQTAQISYCGEVIGWIGMLHPELQSTLNLPTVFLFEIMLKGIEQGKIPAFEPLSKYPSIRRDLALLVDKSVPYQQVLTVAKQAALTIVRDIQLFDVYTGENIDSGVKSLALSLILQAFSHTLTDQEVEAASAAVVQALTTELGAKLRRV